MEKVVSHVKHAFSASIPEHVLTGNYGQLLLRNREQMFQLILEEKEVDRVSQYFTLYALLFAGIYGFLLGFYSGGLQILVGAIKLPMLLFGTLLLCLPALYIFNILLGSQLSFRQTLSILLSGTYLMSTILAALSPILFFFILTTTNRQFISLISLICCSIAGVFALHLVWKGMAYLSAQKGITSNTRILRIWFIIYAIVGTQLAWGLRPFTGEKGIFILLRPIEGNFYLAVFDMFKVLFSGMF